MKKFLSILLVFTMLLSICTVGASAVSVNYGSTSSQASEIKLESDFSLAFKGIFRQFINNICEYFNFTKGLSVIEVKVEDDTISITEGEKVTLKASVKPSKAPNQTIIWKSEDSNIASISSSGVVVGQKAGQTTVYAIADDGGFYDKCTVKVKGKTSPTESIPCKTINSSVQNIKISVGSSKTVNMVLTPSNTTDKVIATSLNVNVATVSVDGNKVTVFGKSQGEAIIKVTCGNVTTKFSAIIVDPTSSSDKTWDYNNGTLTFYADEAVEYFYDNSIVKNGDFPVIQSLIFSEGVTTIPQNFTSTFGIHKEQIKSIYIGETVSLIGSSAFIDCYNIEMFNFNAKKCQTDGPMFEFSSLDIEIYDSDSTVDEIKEWTQQLPKFGTLNVNGQPDDEALFHTGYGFLFTEVNYNAVEILSEMFGAAYVLEKVTIGEDVKRIDDSAFGDCYNLKEFNFNAKDCDTDGPMFNFWDLDIDSFDSGSTVDEIKEWTQQLPKFGTLNVNGQPNDYILFHTGYGFLFTEVNYNAETIPSEMFGNALVLEKVTIGEDVKYIYDFAFGECYNLKEFNFNAKDCQTNGPMFAFFSFDIDSFVPDSTVAEIKEWTQQLPKLGTLNINGQPDDDILFHTGYGFLFTEVNYNAETIPSEMFGNALVLEKVTIGEDVKYIYDFAFGECYNLKEFNFNAKDCQTNGPMFAFFSFDIDSFVPDSTVAEIKEWTQQLPKLGTLNINGQPDDDILFRTGYGFLFTEVNYNAETIPSEMFGNALVLEKVTIGKNVKHIDDSAFGDCFNLKEFNFNASDCQTGGLIFEFFFLNIDLLTSDSTVDEIKEWAQQLPKLGTLNVNGQTDDKYLFQTNYGFLFTEINYNAEEIPSRMFEAAFVLEKVTIGKNVKHIDDSAFENCYNLKEFNFNAKECELNEPVIIYNISNETVDITDSVVLNFNTLNSSVKYNSNTKTITIQSTSYLSENQVSYITTIAEKIFAWEIVETELEVNTNTNTNTVITQYCSGNSSCTNRVKKYCSGVTFKTVTDTCTDDKVSSSTIESWYTSKYGTTADASTMANAYFQSEYNCNHVAGGGITKYYCKGASRKQAVGSCTNYNSSTGACKGCGYACGGHTTIIPN